MNMEMRGQLPESLTPRTCILFAVNENFPSGLKFFTKQKTTTTTKQQQQIAYGLRRKVGDLPSSSTTLLQIMLKY